MYFISHNRDNINKVLNNSRRVGFSNDFFCKKLTGFSRGSINRDTGKLFGFKPHGFAPIGMLGVPGHIKVIAFIAIYFRIAFIIIDHSSSLCSK